MLTPPPPPPSHLDWFSSNGPLYLKLYWLSCGQPLPCASWTLDSIHDKGQEMFLFCIFAEVFAKITVCFGEHVQKFIALLLGTLKIWRNLSKSHRFPFSSNVHIVLWLSEILEKEWPIRRSQVRIQYVLQLLLEAAMFTFQYFLCVIKTNNFQ